MATAEAARNTRRAGTPLVSGPSRTWPSSLKWALLIPVSSTLASWLAQYPHGMWLGIPLTFFTAGAAAVVVGGLWHRGGVATAVCIGAFVLAFFAGPVLYEVYAKQAGEAVDAVVTATGQRESIRHKPLESCTVAEPSGAVHHISQQQNCFGQFRTGQHVTLYKDPAGLLEPFADTPGNRAPDITGLAVTAGLFALTGAGVFLAGQRRR
ncbi:hypothetical protein [Streptomyces cucumeris]|uniref:hypothetical protein n=1 Tax=Streptomyces cucumeris TaxID=2962890 RepID=UPI0020C8B988|nr:hypothetical protein [Streptomyces sp. NEAU-Y11]MCP9212541.1 hypothetical protein [Streptomyces sp. NEAU-Y11]